ncbi:hypothetical protein OG971_39855 [Streptomyces sp. NBC_00847]|nr:hypothetical protein [Streptomyces sp. NBC_00847]
MVEKPGPGRDGRIGSDHRQWQPAALIVPVGALLVSDITHSAMLGQNGTSFRDKETSMSTNPVGRFLAALDPEHRESVGARPHQEQERLAAAWERELDTDDDLDTLDELSPPAAEAEAARRVLERDVGQDLNK